MRDGVADQINNKNKTLKFAVKAGNNTRLDLAELELLLWSWHIFEKVGKFWMVFIVLFILHHYYTVIHLASTIIHGPVLFPYDLRVLLNDFKIIFSTSPHLR